MLNISSIIQSLVPCILSRMWSHMGYQKLLTKKMFANKRMCFCLCQQRTTQARVDIPNCPSCFQFITVWRKRWNFAHLFHCCTTYSTSLSLTCWSFNLTFTGSWRIKAHWARTWWQIFSKFQNFFFVSFSFQSAQIQEIICDCFSDWINTRPTRNSRSLKNKFSFSLHL